MWLGVKAKALLEWLGSGSGTARADVEGCPGAEGTPPSLLSLVTPGLICHWEVLVTLEPICCQEWRVPWPFYCHWLPRSHWPPWSQPATQESLSNMKPTHLPEVAVCHGASQLPRSHCPPRSGEHPSLSTAAGLPEAHPPLPPALCWELGVLVTTLLLPPSRHDLCKAASQATNAPSGIDLNSALIVPFRPYRAKGRLMI